MSDPVPPPRRLPRTTGGLIGSMIVVIVLVIGFVVFRSLFRHQTIYHPDHVDYLEAVGDAQAAHRSLVYPASLPDGWIADSIDYDPEGKLKFSLGMLTDASDNGAKGDFVGYVEQDEVATKLLDSYAKGDPTAGPDYRASGAVAPVWQTWTTDDGDRAYSAVVDGHTLFVYGDASAADQEQLIGLLTDAVLPSPHASASPS